MDYGYDSYNRMGMRRPYGGMRARNYEYAYR